MFTYWNDFDRTFETMDSLFRRFLDPNTGSTTPMGGGFRTTQMFETDDEVVLSADLPGVRPDDVEISLHDGVLSVLAERKDEVPEGYEARRVERGQVRFARTFTLPATVDAERTRATLTNGVLTVHMEKAADAKPRRIAINA